MMAHLTYLSNQEHCQQQWEQKQSCAVIARCLIPSVKPLDAFSQLTNHGRDPFSFLYQSLQDGDRIGRQSIMGWKPDVIFTTMGEKGTFFDSDLEEITPFKNPSPKPLDQMQTFLDHSAFSLPEGVPSAVAGVFGYVGYDVVRLVETLPLSPPSQTGMPDAVLTRPTLLLIFEHDQHCLFLCAPHYWDGQKDENFEHIYRTSKKQLEHIANMLAQTPQDDAIKATPTFSHPKIIPTCNMSLEWYEQCFQKIQHHIEEGEIFQAVLALRFSCECFVDGVDLYHELCHINPSPYMFFIHTPWGRLIGSSPETFLSLSTQKTLTMHPIAGTKRLPQKEQDVGGVENALLNDPKERAEHLMLLDLARNDIGRIAETGSVCCPKTFALQRTSHLLHIISVVEGRLKKEETALSALLKVLPAGTVSGAPKHRAMTIINSLEQERRTFYAGALGYFSADGSMDTCLTLRTALLDHKGHMHVFAGSGIVKDSQMHNERKECHDKALVFFDTLNIMMATPPVAKNKNGSQTGDS